MHVHPELGGQHDLVAPAAEHLAEELLAGAGAAVDVGGVEEGDALVERGVDDGAGAFEVDAAAEVVAAEADDRDVQPRVSERAGGKLWHRPFYSSQSRGGISRAASARGRWAAGDAPTVGVVAIDTATVHAPP